MGDRVPHFMRVEIAPMGWGAAALCEVAIGKKEIEKNHNVKTVTIAPTLETGTQAQHELGRGRP